MRRNWKFRFEPKEWPEKEVVLLYVVAGLMILQGVAKFVTQVTS